MNELQCSFMQFPKFEFYDPKTPIFTSPRFLPPTKIEKSRVCLYAQRLDLISHEVSQF